MHLILCQFPYQLIGDNTVFQCCECFCSVVCIIMYYKESKVTNLWYYYTTYHHQ